MPPAEAAPSSLGARGGDVGFAVRLPRSTGAARGARHAVKQRFGDVLASDTLDDALLVVSELVTSAVLHGVGDIELRLAFDGQRVSGDVIDEGIQLPRQLGEHGRDDAGARGLRLVAHIAHSWGLRERSGHVWFEILAQRPI